MIFTDVFTEIAALLLISAVAGALGLWLKQPLIVSFIAAGMVMGPSVPGMVSANDQVGLLAGLGISLLLFVVGLKLDLHIIRAFGPVALATGLGQVFFASVVGFFLALALGMAVVPAIYVAVALTFSSTITIVKLPTRLRELGAHLALTPFADAAADAVRQLLSLPTNLSENPTISTSL